MRVEIPRIGVSSTLECSGSTGQGTCRRPATRPAPAWYPRGPTPGALGPAVIAGHVTWNRVPAVFFRLGSMRRGDRVDVARADGTRAVFAVTRVARFDKASFPTGAVFGGIDHAGLRLITCGGSYDTSTHRYADNWWSSAGSSAAEPWPSADHEGDDVGGPLRPGIHDPQGVRPRCAQVDVRREPAGGVRRGGQRKATHRRPLGAARGGWWRSGSRARCR